MYRHRIPWNGFGSLRIHNNKAVLRENQWPSTSESVSEGLHERSRPVQHPDRATDCLQVFSLTETFCTLTYLLIIYFISNFELLN